jgi:hypothetical protein
VDQVHLDNSLDLQRYLMHLAGLALHQGRSQECMRSPANLALYGPAAHKLTLT